MPNPDYTRTDLMDEGQEKLEKFLDKLHVGKGKKRPKGLTYGELVQICMGACDSMVAAMDHRLKDYNDAYIL